MFGYTFWYVGMSWSSHFSVLLIVNSLDFTNIHIQFGVIYFLLLFLSRSLKRKRRETN